MNHYFSNGRGVPILVKKLPAGLKIQKRIVYINICLKKIVCRKERNKEKVI